MGSLEDEVILLIGVASELPVYPILEADLRGAIPQDGSSEDGGRMFRMGNMEGVKKRLREIRERTFCSASNFLDKETIL